MKQVARMKRRLYNSLGDHRYVRQLFARSKTMKHWKLILILGMSAAIVCLVLIAGVLIAFVSYKDPAPVRAFSKYRGIIYTYVESINAGRIPKRNGAPNGGYLLLDVLQPHGRTAVTKSTDGSVHFVFESMPCDATPSLVYCPNSRFDLRKIEPVGGNAIVEGKMLEPCWFYCEADTE